MVNYKISEGWLECSFPARLDTPTCIKWEDSLFGRINDEKLPVVFNMEGVVYISSTFLRICLQLAQKLGREGFKATNISQEVRKIFEIAGFGSVVGIE